MENRINDIDELIGKCLAWEASEEEIKLVDSWRRESDDNEKYFQQFRIIFDRAASVKETIDVDQDAAWNKLKARLRNGEKVVPLYETPPAAGYMYLKIAASILLLAIAGFFAYQMFSPAAPVEVFAEQKIVTDTLPDGSEVVLNKKSQLSYNYNKNKRQHTVKLKGEAYFSIHHKDDKDFVIDASGVFIRDIGTSFNVKAYPESNTIEVVVEEGEVVFYTATDSGVTLKANGKGVYNKTTKTFSVETPETNVTSYKTRVFHYSQTTLGEVIDDLNKVYDKKIIISESLRGCQYTGEFVDERIEEIAAVIRLSYEDKGMTLRETNEGIVLEGPPCNP